MVERQDALRRWYSHRVNSHVVGGIGASGGSIAQDIEVANAGLGAIQQ